MTVSILNSGNYIALIIALQQLHLYAKAISRRADVSTQAVIIITAIDIFFTDAQHIDVRTI